MKRLLAGVALGALAVLLTAPTASGQSVPPREDSLFDAISPKGDIMTSTYSASFTDSVITVVKFRVTTWQGSNPVTAPAWHNTNTEIRAFLDVTAAHVGPDYRVTLSAEGAGPFTFEATVESLLPNPVVVECGATATFVAPNLYKGVVPGACLSAVNPTQVRERVVMTWDPPPAGGTQGTDKAPNSGWGPFLQAA